MLNFECNNSGRFFVQSNREDNDDFVNRQKSVFEQLDAVVKDKEKSSIKQENSNNHMEIVRSKSLKRRRTDTRQFRGQESIFKRPEAPPPSRFKRNIPDYVKNPQKWTKYSLDDVSQEDMSDRSNTAAAMSFLRELKAKKEIESMEVDEEKQITFKKPTNFKTQKTDGQRSTKYESPIFRSSKVVMPEYVVGEKKILKKNLKLSKPTEKAQKYTEIKLDHLVEEDDD